MISQNVQTRSFDKYSTFYISVDKLGAVERKKDW